MLVRRQLRSSPRRTTRSCSRSKGVHGPAGRKGGRLLTVPLAAEFADPIANGATMNRESISNLGQGPMLDKNRSQRLVATMPGVGRLEKKRFVRLAVHDKPPCKMSSIYPSHSQQYDTAGDLRPRAKNRAKAVESVHMAPPPCPTRDPAEPPSPPKLNDKSATENLKTPGKADDPPAKMSLNYGLRKSAFLLTPAHVLLTFCSFCSLYLIFAGRTRSLTPRPAIRRLMGLIKSVFYCMPLALGIWIG